MAVTCAKCGEELLGAVNRCWRCGQHVLSAPGSGEAPPVRQIPQPGVNLLPVPTATIVIDESGEAVEPVDAIEVDSPTPTATPPILPEGMPMALPQTIAPPPLAADYSQRGVVFDAAAIASIVLGALALLLGVFFSWAVVFGLLGLAAGLWGARSRYRQLAVVGLLVSLMGVCGSSARLAFDTFSWWSGQSQLIAPTTPNADTVLPDSLD